VRLLIDACSASSNAANLHHCMNPGRQQAFDARLELAILRSVDQRVDAAVEEHQHHGEVVEPAREVETVQPDDAQTEANLVDWPARDKSTTDHQWRHHSVASSCIHAWTGCYVHLKEHQQARLCGLPMRFSDLPEMLSPEMPWHRTVEGL